MARCFRLVLLENSFNSVLSTRIHRFIDVAESSKYLKLNFLLEVSRVARLSNCRLSVINRHTISSCWHATMILSDVSRGAGYFNNSPDNKKKMSAHLNPFFWVARAVLAVGYISIAFSSPNACLSHTFKRKVKHCKAHSKTD